LLKAFVSSFEAGLQSFAARDELLRRRVQDAFVNLVGVAVVNFEKDVVEDDL
jgi:hypothetical protein